MAAPRYYGLIASLPHLPPPAVAMHLPMSWHALNSRLATLSEEHRDQILLALQGASWRLLQRERVDLQQSRHLHRLQAEVSDPHLRNALAFRIDQMVLIAALRRRRTGAGVPDANWGTGRWPFWLRRHWDEDHFGLQQQLPWLAPASQHLASGDAVALELVLMGAFWSYLDRLTWGQDFGFAEVVAFVFKWDMLCARLIHEPVRAAARYRELANEVTRHVRIA